MIAFPLRLPCIPRIAAIGALTLPALAQQPDALADPSRLGGAATIFDSGPNAFGFPAPELTPTERRAFAVGNSFFKQNWIAAPASTTGRDGLGPLFNARSCSSCHQKDGRSRPPADGEPERHGLLLRIGVRRDGGEGGADLPHPRYGAQLQDAAIRGAAPEARHAITLRTIAGAYGDGTPFELVAPGYAVIDLADGPLDGDDVPGKVVLSPRTAPQLIGLGLLEAIPAESILALADPDDGDGDGISGRPNLLRGPDGDTVLGRFGWKATQPDVRSQTAAAFVNDMGITSRLEPQEALTPAQRRRLGLATAAPAGDAIDIADHAFERVVFYTRVLAVPAQRDAGSPLVAAGRERFVAFGCARCHVPAHRTGAVDVHAAFADQTIFPYTDLLLHDLGEGLADGKRDGDAGPTEWRTPPLWGVGLVPVVNGHSRYLHDGRARDLAEAVLWHGGEAAAARERFRTAPAADRAALLAFLQSL